MMLFGDPVIDEYNKKAAGCYRLLSQDEFWVDVEKNVLRIDDMSVRYKRNALTFLARRATRIGNLYTWGSAFGIPSGYAPCVIGVGADGKDVECGATGSWAHGVYHGLGPAPDSMASLMLDAEIEREMKMVRLSPIRWLHQTRLGARLVRDVNNRIGGTLGDDTGWRPPAA